MKNAGCDWIQGYYFSRPLPLEDFRELLLKFKKKEAADKLSHQLEKLDEEEKNTGKLRNELIFTPDTLHDEIARQKKYFDIVRMVDPEKTMVCDAYLGGQEGHTCYSVWGKNERCSNCISLKALKEAGRYCKVEYIKDQAYFVVSQYIQVSDKPYTMEMVAKLDQDWKEV